MKVIYLKTLVGLLVLCAIAMEMKAQTSADSAYVDMNLPSGTLWKLVNESNEFYEYEDAKALFGKALPSQEQYEELIKHCQWIWTGTGYLVKARNGNVIEFPACGYYNCDGYSYDEGISGRYWTSTEHNKAQTYYLAFDVEDISVDYYKNCFGRSVRLVKK